MHRLGARLHTDEGTWWHGDLAGGRCGAWCLALASPSIGAPAAAQVASVSKQKPVKLSANFHKIRRRHYKGRLLQFNV